MRHQLRFFTQANRADQRDRLPRAEGPRAGHALPSQRSRIFAAHPGFYKRFIDEDEAANVRGLQELAERFAPLAMLWRVALAGDE